MYLTRYGLLAREDTLQRQFGEHYQKFLSRLHLTHYPAMGPAKVLTAYRRRRSGGTTYIQLPRRMMIDAGAGICGVLPVVPAVHAADMRVPLLPHQVVAVRAVIDAFSAQRQAAGAATAILDMPPGTGKTVVAAAVAMALRQRMLFVSPRKHLAKQAVDDIVSKTTLRVCRGLRDDCDVCVVVINSAVTMTPEQIARFSFVVYDEIHMYCSRARKDVFFNINVRCTLGLSGTPLRKDGFDQLYRWYLGEPITARTLPGFAFEAVAFDLRVTFIDYHGPAALTQTRTHSRTGRPFVHYMYEQMLADDRRNKVIASELVRLYDAGHCTYVFAEECAHLQRLIAYLRAHVAELRAVVGGDLQPLLEGDTCIGYFVGGVTQAEATRIKTSARIVFTTYGLSAVGTSWQHMTAMVLATPRKSGITQLAARIMRLGSDPAIVREIVDVVDTRTFLRRQKKERMISYRECGAIMSTRVEGKGAGGGRGRRVQAAPADGYEIIE